MARQQENLIRCSTDTSSIILLENVELLGIAANACRFHVSSAVYGELMKQDDAFCADDIESFVTVHSTMDISPNKLSLTSNDATIINIYHQAPCDAVLSDDGRILKFCKTMNIPHYCSLSLLAILARKGILTPIQIDNYLDRLVKIGYYSPWVVEHAKAMLNATRPNT